MAVEAVPIQEGLFSWPSRSPRLLASRCKSCDEVTFPLQEACPSCTARSSEQILLSPRGRLWTFTIQRFPPPVPPYTGEADRDAYVPFGVGYVELPEGVRVEARLTENDPQRLEIGMEMELVIEPFGRDEAGRTLLTFAFRPAESSEAA